MSFIDVTFDSPISGASFTAADVSLSGPSGNISVGAPHKLTGNVYRIPFAAQRANGSYTLRIGPNIADLVGNPMDQN